MARFLFLSIIILWNVSCSEKYEIDENIKFTTMLSEKGNTKTSISSGLITTFISGDKIGISETLTNKSNILFSYNGTSWTTSTPMYWYNSTSQHTFYAYYPYISTNQGNNVVIPLLSTQDIGVTLSPSLDMLVAEPKQQVRSSNVALKFNHAFALLQFSVISGLINTTVIKSITVRGGNSTGTQRYGIINTSNNVSQVWYNLISGAIEAASNSTASYSQTITDDIPSPGLIGTAPVVVYALVLPGQYTNPAPSISFKYTPLLSGDRNTAFVNIGTTTFVAGNKYSYNVKVGGLITKSASEVEVEFVSQEDSLTEKWI